MPQGSRPERVQKILARAGVGSRRAVEKLITDGRVTLDGEPVKLGDSAVDGQCRLEVDGFAVETLQPRVYVVLNKPSGVLSSSSDDRGRPTVIDAVDRSLREGSRLFPVGRLDMDSTGLILLTNDGFLANRLAHPSFEVEREYMVEVDPVPTRSDLGRLRSGVPLEEGDSGAAKVSLVAEDGGRGLVKMVIHTGRKRQIRRSFEFLGYRVMGLARTRFGPLRLGNLGPGETRVLGEDEVRRLYRQAGL